jgi:hypothetical protein
MKFSGPVQLYWKFLDKDIRLAGLQGEVLGPKWLISSESFFPQGCDSLFGNLGTGARKNRHLIFGVVPIFKTEKDSLGAT